MKSRLTIFVACVLVLTAFAYAANRSNAVQTKTATATTAQAKQSNVTKIAYAQLSVSNDQYIFETSGNNVTPRVFDLRGLYATLGGRQRPTLINLLGKIGDQGWELVQISNDESVFVFKK